MALTYLDRKAPVGEIVKALRRDGAVAVTALARPATVDAVVAELRPNLDAAAAKEQSVFDGTKTRRFGAIMRSAPSAAELVDHELVVTLADEFLLPHCATYQVSSLTAVEILPGEGAQALHRDDSLYPIELAGMELQLSVMWALSDFTKENGGTRVVPGSHRFIRSWHLPDLSGWEAAVMPKGSALFYLGSTWHGGGANESTSMRTGLINTYCLGWLRQEANQYLETPPEVASKFNPRLRALLGYTPHGCGDDEIGSFEGECAGWLDTPPESAWQDGRGQIGSAADAKAQSES
ncbi:MAG: phytanoyl-CoA dioxygenase family protein [Myxococcota bacterium]|nr:phytanoyl-CoA dioxygenase family protein [Myxococcota bacterium]